MRFYAYLIGLFNKKKLERTEVNRIECDLCGVDCGQCGGPVKSSYIWDTTKEYWVRNLNFK
jgi:hypothetical protein